jgi:hypothetical protein
MRPDYESFAYLDRDACYFSQQKNKRDSQRFHFRFFAAAFFAAFPRLRLGEMSLISL